MGTRTELLRRADAAWRGHDAAVPRRAVLESCGGSTGGSPKCHGAESCVRQVAENERFRREHLARRGTGFESEHGAHDPFAMRARHLAAGVAVRRDVDAELVDTWET